MPGIAPGIAASPVLPCPARCSNRTSRQLFYFAVLLCVPEGGICGVHRVWGSSSGLLSRHAYVSASPLSLPTQSSLTCPDEIAVTAELMPGRTTGLECLDAGGISALVPGASTLPGQPACHCMPAAPKLICCQRDR